MSRPYHRNLRDTHSAPTDPMQPHPSFPHRRANAESSWSYLTQKGISGDASFTTGVPSSVGLGGSIQCWFHVCHCNHPSHRPPAQLPPRPCPRFSATHHLFHARPPFYPFFATKTSLNLEKKYADHSFYFVFLYAHSYCHHQIHGRQSQRTTRRT